MRERCEDLGPRSSEATSTLEGGTITLDKARVIVYRPRGPVTGPRSPAPGTGCPITRRFGPRVPATGNRLPLVLLFVLPIDVVAFLSRLHIASSHRAYRSAAAVLQPDAQGDRLPHR